MKKTLLPTLFASVSYFPVIRTGELPRRSRWPGNRY